MKRKGFLLVCALLANTLIVLAQEHFTFVVPVELHLIPEELSVFVVSAHVKDQMATPEGYERGSLIGDGYTTVVMPANGEYSGNVIVKFNAREGKDPAAAVYWKVSMRFFYSGPVSKFTLMEETSEYPHDPSKPYILQFSGAIPRAAQSEPTKIKTVKPMIVPPRPKGTDKRK